MEEAACLDLRESRRRVAESARRWGPLGSARQSGAIPAEYIIVVESDYLQITWEHRNEGVFTEGCSGLMRLLGPRLTEQGRDLGSVLSSLL